MAHQAKRDRSRDLTGVNELQALLELYKEQCSHGRHTEGQRHLVAAMFLTAAGALLAVASANKFSHATWPLSASICVLGLLGLGFARVYEIKWDELGVRRNYYREQIEDITGILPIPRGFTPRHLAEDAKPPSRIFARLRTYWRATFLFVIAVGAVATWLALRSPQNAPEDGISISIRQHEPSR